MLNEELHTKQCPERVQRVTVYTVITCLTVNPENALETLSDTVQLRPVVELDELVVLHPGGQLGKAEVVPVLH